MKAKLNEQPYLTPLFNAAKKEGFTIVYNRKPLQEFSPSVCTCGKHCISVANAFVDGLNLQQYLKMMETKHEATGSSYDQIVNELYEMF